MNATGAFRRQIVAAGFWAVVLVIVLALGGDAWAKPEFLSGEAVRFSATLDDDVFAAGQRVVFDNVTVEDVFAAGRTVQFGGRAESVIAAGETVEVHGTVTDDVIAAGAFVTLGPNTEVGSNAVLAGRNLVLNGRIGGVLTAAAERIEITGRIEGDADLFAERVVLAAGSRIGGNLRLAQGGHLVRDPGAEIVGGVSMIDVEAYAPRPPLMGWVGGILAWIAVFVGLVVLGVGLALVFPGLLNAAADTLAERPGGSALRGLLLLFGLPLLAILLFVTIAGIPLGFVVLAIYALGLAAAAVAAGLALGRLLLNAARRRESRYYGTGGRVGRTVLGLVVLAIIGTIPILGGLAWLAALVLGLGALAQPTWHRLRTERI